MSANGINGGGKYNPDEGELGHGIQVIDENKEFTTEMPDYLKAVDLLNSGFSYHLISVFGSQSTGKSTLLNHLFNTSFPVMDETRRQQTTKGIWMSHATDPDNITSTSGSDKISMGRNILVCDVEGTDGRERGEDQDFERKAALFALATSEVLIVNIWEHQVGLYQGANMGLLKTVFEVNLQLFQKDQATTHRSLLFFVIRDHIGRTPLENLANTLIADLNNIWYGLNKPPGLETSRIADFFDFAFTALPHKVLQPEQFVAETKKLRLRFRDATSSSTSPNHNGMVEGKDSAIFLPAYHRRIPADGLPHYAANIWRMITENKDLDLPTQQELLAQYRCDEISVVCVEGFDSIIVPFEEKLSNKQVLPGLGESMEKARSDAMNKFTEEAGRYHKGVYGRKREELDKKLLSRLRVLFNAQLAAAHKQATTVFSDTIVKGLKGGKADFATLVESTREEVLKTFEEEAESCSMNGVFTFVDETKAVQADLNEVATRLRGEEMARLLNRMERSLKNKLASDDEGVPFQFKTISATLYQRVWDLWTKSTATQIDTFLSKSSALNSTKDEDARAVHSLKKRAWRLLRDVLDEETREPAVLTRLMAMFDKSFRYDEAGVPRVWRAADDIEGGFKKARDAVQQLIPGLSIFKLENGNEPKLTEFIGPAPETNAEASTIITDDAEADLSDEEEDTHSPNSSKTFVILTPGKTASLTEAFQRQADQAFVDAKRGTISSVSQIPFWFYVLLLVLGWNELWAVLMNPLYFMMLLIAGAGGYITWTLNLWGPMMSVGQATSIQVMEMGKQQLREFLEIKPEAMAMQPLPAGQASGRSYNEPSGENIRMRTVDVEGKVLIEDSDD